MSRQRAAAIVSEAAELASERLTARGLPALPNTTPHTLRRTYISIALLANRFDVLWVMSQVGHADSKMTMDVYAQLQQRVDREHGRAFDALVRQARGRLYGAEEVRIGHHWAVDWAVAPNRSAFRASPRRPLRGKQKGPASRAFRSGETRTRTGDTTIFSRVLYQLSYLAVGA